MRLLLIEDDFKTMQLIKQGLEENFYEVDVAYDGLIGKQLALRNQYAVIITDIILPGINGLTLICELRDAGVKTPILILSAMGELNDRIAGFDAGADQYLLKPFIFIELLARIRSLIKRSSDVHITQNILKFEDLEANLDTKSIRRNDKVIELTAQEFKLLEYFLRNQGRVLSKVQIAEKVWDVDFDRRTNYVEVYINYLRKKIDKDFQRKLIHTVFGMGYVLR
ncbi:response regulator transcription factor [Emticicia sp. BO119]|uniref:winged helix-turn-helix domain-containing protein n=1 Tax=Emticicia sp. BO119 TaxID=2757768 RepID=UPI0015F0BABA|nr:response regulator transcription factor [Emticicia sp. BO119]MBA4849307.1 response regulator transcription factor [Emticicia sp. BO119]